MSPEQASGQPVDKRSDIWSFGVVLFEMLTGQRLFTGESVSHVIGAILQTQPRWDDLPPAAPPSVKKLVRRCLEKDRTRRLRDMGDARPEFEDAFASPSTEEEKTGDEGRPRATTFALVVAAVVGAFVAGGLFDRWVAPPAGSETGSFGIGLPVDAPLALDRGIPNGFDMRLFDLSPDGTRLVYVADLGTSTQLYSARIGSFDADPLPGTEGAYNPFFSPDGEWVGYVGGTELRRVSLLGGRPERICGTTGVVLGAAWDGDDIYFVDGGTGAVLNRVSASGGSPTVVSRADVLPGVQGFWPVAALPDGRGILGTTSRFAPASGDYHDITVWSPAAGEWHTILEAAGYDVRYSPTGHLIYARAGGLWAVSFDLERLEVTGDPVPILDDVRVDAVFGYAQFAVSPTGTLVYTHGGDVAVGTPTWIDLEGNAEPLKMPAQNYGVFALSPDGRRLAIQVVGPTDHVWVYDIATGIGSRLTIQGNNGWPIWTRDGERVVFSSDRLGTWGLWAKTADGRGAAVELYQSDQWILPYSWSPQEDVVALGVGADLRVELLSIDWESQEATRVPYPQTDGVLEWGHRFSPDGKGVAYATSKDGDLEVYVRPYPGLDREYRVSDNVGMEPVWSSSPW